MQCGVEGESEWRSPVEGGTSPHPIFEITAREPVPNSHSSRLGAATYVLSKRLTILYEKEEKASWWS